MILIRKPQNLVQETAFMVTKLVKIEIGHTQLCVA